MTSAESRRNKKTGLRWLVVAGSSIRLPSTDETCGVSGASKLGLWSGRRRDSQRFLRTVELQAYDGRYVWADLSPGGMWIMESTYRPILDGWLSGDEVLVFPEGREFELLNVERGTVIRAVPMTA